MSAARFFACVTVASACLSGTAALAAPRMVPLAQAPDGATPRTPLKIVQQVPVEVPADLDPKLGRVLVQLEADVAADGAVSTSAWSRSASSRRRSR